MQDSDAIVIQYEPVQGERRHYRVYTAHGSVFNVTFKPTASVPNEQGVELLVGEMYLSGIAQSVGRRVTYLGIGWMPEVGGHLTVSEIEYRADGTPVRSVELITRVEEVEQNTNTSDRDRAHDKRLSEPDEVAGQTPLPH